MYYMIFQKKQGLGNEGQEKVIGIRYRYLFGDFKFWN